MLTVINGVITTLSELLPRDNCSRIDGQRARAHSGGSSSAIGALYGDTKEVPLSDINQSPVQGSGTSNIDVSSAQSAMYDNHNIDVSSNKRGRSASWSGCNHACDSFITQDEHSAAYFSVSDMSGTSASRISGDIV